MNDSKPVNTSAQTASPSAERSTSFSEYLLSGPKFDDFVIERAKDTDREVDLTE